MVTEPHLPAVADSVAALSTVATPPPDAAEALEVLRKGSRSFHFASYFLPADRRADAALLYSFCRYVDDVADDAPSVLQAQADLNRLQDELTGRVEPRPFMAAVVDLFARRDVDHRHALELIEGVRSDLGTVRLADDAALIVYGYRVAGTVGLMMCGVLGVAERVALPFAIDLGVAMQITNICRDVAEDAGNGRLYVPATRLIGKGVPAEPGALVAHREPLRRVVLDMLDLADRYYESAAAGMRFIPFPARMAIHVASRVYRAIGLRLRRSGGDPLRGRTVVPMTEKVFWAGAALLDAMRWSARPARAHRADLHRPLAGLPGAHA